MSVYVATIPPQPLSANKYVTLSGDLFFVNKVPFFATITTFVHTLNRKIKQLVQVSKHVQAVYRARSFRIKYYMLMDIEFVPMKHELLLPVLS